MSPKVGDPVWVYDENRRVYQKNGIGSPIYREHWVKRQIVGETSRSWIIGYEDRPDSRSAFKVAKSGPSTRKVAYSQAELDECCWAHDHRYRIIRIVERCSPQDLCKIAELIGYEVRA